MFQEHEMPKFRGQHYKYCTFINYDAIAASLGFKILSLFRTGQQIQLNQFEMSMKISRICRLAQKTAGCWKTTAVI